MQLSSLSKLNNEPTMVCDYFPIVDSTQFMYKVLKFQGVDTMSTKVISMDDFKAELNERIELGYTVTGFNTKPVSSKVIQLVY